MVSLPLFNKLYNLSNESDRSIPNTFDSYINSIENEINRLLETRHPKKFSDSDPINLLSYGLPENVWVKAKTENGRARAERKVVDLLKYFEPRFHDPKVTINRKNNSVNITISGTVVFSGQKEKVEFSTTLS